MSSTLVLHRGAKVVSRQELDQCPAPQPTATHTPLPHSVLLDQVELAMIAAGVRFRDHSLAISKDGQQFFGLITLHESSHDYATTVGVKNSHDKSLSAALAIGHRVFVCDNLAFSSEVVIKARHSSRIIERLPRLVAEGIDKLIEHRGFQHRRIAAYKKTAVEDARHLHDLVLRSFRNRVIPNRAIEHVIDAFENPEHDEFRDWTLWSLFNAITGILKACSKLQDRTQRLHGLFDIEAKLLSK